MIESEDDVRAWVREASGGKARWVEPALGSTPGLPDCWVPHEGRCVHFELKAGIIKDGKIRFTVRPEQARQIRQMAEGKVPVGFIVGISGTPSVAFIAATRESLSGKVRVAGGDTERFWVDQRLDSKASFQRGVNFIFSEFVSHL